MALQCTIVCIWLFRDTVPPSVVSLSLSLHSFPPLFPFGLLFLFRLFPTLHLPALLSGL